MGTEEAELDPKGFQETSGLRTICKLDLLASFPAPGLMSARPPEFKNSATSTRTSANFRYKTTKQIAGVSGIHCPL